MEWNLVVNFCNWGATLVHITSSHDTSVIIGPEIHPWAEFLNNSFPTIITIVTISYHRCPFKLENWPFHLLSFRFETMPSTIGSLLLLESHQIQQSILLTIDRLTNQSLLSLNCPHFFINQPQSVLKLCHLLLNHILHDVLCSIPDASVNRKIL